MSHTAPGEGTRDVRRQLLAAERITVALIPKVADNLQLLQERADLSKTDITNRAITLYEFIVAQIRSGQDILIRDQTSKEIKSVTFL